MKYKSLNDAAKNAAVHAEYRSILSPGDIRIWYVSDWEGQFSGIDTLKRFGIPLPTPSNIWDSHKRLGSIHAAAATPRQGLSLDVIYEAMQGENWSPKGEARDLIKGLGLRHTSMSIGDIIQPTDGALWYVDTYGFKKIWPRPNPTLRRGSRPGRKKNPSDLRSIMRKYG